MSTEANLGAVDMSTEPDQSAVDMSTNTASISNAGDTSTNHEPQLGAGDSHHHSNLTRKKSKKQKRKKKGNKNINIMYANPMGITGKINSLIAVAQTSKAHIIGLAETKLGKTTPSVPGYSWVNKPKKTGSGGVAILIRDDIKHMAEQVEGLEDQDQEIVWVKIKINKAPVYIGVFYGPQEKCSKEESQRQFSQITSQINKLKNKGNIILMGDFNAKLDIQKPGISQKESRNGEHMQDMINNTNMAVKSLSSSLGNWTRVKRKDPNERSIIDYVLMTDEISQSTKNIEIDEYGMYRLKGKEESDHNTIIIETSIPRTKNITKQTIYNLKDKKKWRQFNYRLQETYQDRPPVKYDDFENMIKNNMKKTFDKITITKGNFKPKLSEKAKMLKQERKTRKKAFEKATKGEKKDKLDDYITTQKQLREEIERLEKEKVQARINIIIKEGGVKSESFWKIRKKIINKSKPTDDYDTVTEDNEVLNDPDQAKEYIANYYENLYQAREGCPEYAEWTDTIKNTVAEIEESMKQLPHEPEFTPDEMLNAIKRLKPGKAPGPDGIPNEVLKRANHRTLPIYTQEMNKVMAAEEIPEQSTEGNLKRLHKGKGKKGKCSHERGITLASNIGKTFERLINNRIIEEVNMSDAQAGGIKGRATVDHIMILKELVNICKAEKKEAILIYLDVTKAYDKAWLDAIMYVLHKQGINSRLWLLVKKLNSNLKTTVLTKHGPTRQITIKDRIRQGGIISVILYALMMDEINKELMEAGKGITVPNTDCKIPSLLWMDDVVLIENEVEKSQELLNITDHTSKKYHVEFGMPKTKHLRTSKKENKIELKLGQQEIEETEKYTYLGEVNNKLMNLKDQIKLIEGKVEAAYQTLLAVAEDREFKGIQMQCIWKLINTCIVPMITYASETWEPNKQEMKKLNQLLDKILRRVLMTPDATPRQALYIETGLLDIETVIDKKRLCMMARLKQDSSVMMNHVLTNPACKWKKKTREIMEKYNVYEWELAEEKFVTRRIISERIREKFHEKMSIPPKEKQRVYTS